MNATRPPRVSSCRPTAMAPSSSSTPIMRVRDQVQAGPERAAQPGLGQFGAEHLGRLPGVLGGRLAAPAERLEHADPGGRLLHVGGQVALLVLGAPGQHPVAPLELGAGPHDRQEHRPGQQAEPPVQPDQQHDHGDERDHVGDQEDGAEAGEPADRGQVVGRPGQQLPGLPGVVERGRQPLQVRVDVRPHGLVQPGDRVGLHPAAEEVEHRLQHAEADRGRADRQQQVAAAVADRPVDHRLGEQRDGDLAEHRDDRGGQHERQLPPVRAQVAAGPPERGEGCPAGAAIPGPGSRKRAGLLRGHYSDASCGAAAMSPEFSAGWRAAPGRPAARRVCRRWQGRPKWRQTGR